MSDWFLKLWIWQAIYPSYSQQNMTPHPSEKQPIKGWTEDKLRLSVITSVRTLLSGYPRLNGDWPIWSTIWEFWMWNKRDANMSEEKQNQ